MTLAIRIERQVLGRYRNIPKCIASGKRLRPPLFDRRTFVSTVFKCRTFVPNVSLVAYARTGAASITQSHAIVLATKKLKKRTTFIDSDIFTVSNVLNAQECAALIERAESIGFAAASVRTDDGPKMMKGIRNNDRVNLTDPGLAELMWTRIASVLPVFDNQSPASVDYRIRFYRYEPGQEFKRHKDGCVTSEDGLRSKLSYLIYLNDEYEGGETVFREYMGHGQSRQISELSIEPAVGMALLFRHERWHAGSPLTAGKKYVLRSDVFYKPAD